MKGFVAEFKAFAVKGNVIDLAAAVVIGTAFGKIVSSLVTNIITPLIGVLMGGRDVSGMMYTLGNAEITYGVFLQSIIDFFIVALFIFMVVKAINRAQDAFYREEVPVENKPVEPPEEIRLLREIRDTLKNK